MTLTLRENLTLRLVGLFIFIAPAHGARFLAGVVVGVNDRVARIERERDEKVAA